MKVTVCQLSDDMKQFEADWNNLVIHCQSYQSELVLLPEMPFYTWIANKTTVDRRDKLRATAAHEEWISRIDELGSSLVAYSKPVIEDDKFYNTAYVWSKEKGHQKVRSKYLFPEEEGFYEETWFDREPKQFELIEVNGLKIGFLLCTEIWFTGYTRQYALEGIDILLCPRATGKSSIAQWLRVGQTSSVIGGCYCLSSNRAGVGPDGFTWGGTGWISRPMDGQLLETTSNEERFTTVDIDVEKSKLAKKEYPIYVKT